MSPVLKVSCRTVGVLLRYLRGAYFGQVNKEAIGLRAQSVHVEGQSFIEIPVYQSVFYFGHAELAIPSHSEPLQ